ncbi:AAA family ATPase [Hyalangium gracile]|uniref:AAA family ATPase n=1 Tax=Hyalangium gracile TaxID=394092 RepID=UPI001CCA5800|nr:AAA family ATPase [Hyalangium gracile]
MTTSYLRRIEISNFRTYGADFSLSLPGPGVTILTGPDGLGKRTLFEAIEWALTGQACWPEALHREGQERGRDSGLLARREEDVPVEQYRVCLEFVSGEAESSRIERRAAREQESRERFAELSSPTRQQLLELLRAGSWSNEIGDLGEHLRLTHLRGHTGAAELELIARSLGAEATRALTERVRQLELEKDLARRALDSWHDLLSRRPRLAQLTATGGGPSSGALTERALAIAAALKATLGVELAPEGAPPADVLLERLSQAVAEAEARRDMLLQLITARRKVAEGVKQKSLLVGQNDRHTHELWMIQSYLRDINKNIQKITTLDDKIRSLLLEQEQRPSALAEDSQRHQQELETARAARDQLPDLGEINEQRASTQARIAQLSSAIKENHQVVARIEQELLAAQALLQQHPELLATLDTPPGDEANLDPMSSSDQPKALVEQEARLQELREQQRRLADAWLAWQREEEQRQVESEGSERASRESLPSVDAIAERLRASWATRVVDLALLSSMSAAYPWSRWPALLLDEPLRQQDLIHPAALIEVLRSLVQDRKYQVILSTHDEELADRMRRELVVTGIECVTCRYKGAGPTGVLYSTD